MGSRRRIDAIARADVRIDRLVEEPHGAVGESSHDASRMVTAEGAFPLRLGSRPVVHRVIGRPQHLGEVATVAAVGVRVIQVEPIADATSRVSVDQEDRFADEKRVAETVADVMDPGRRAGRAVESRGQKDPIGPIHSTWAEVVMGSVTSGAGQVVRDVSFRHAVHVGRDWRSLRRAAEERNSGFHQRLERRAVWVVAPPPSGLRPRDRRGQGHLFDVGEQVCRPGMTPRRMHAVRETPVGVVVVVHGQPQLPQMMLALHPPGSHARRVDRRQEQREQRRRPQQSQ